MKKSRELKRGCWNSGGNNSKVEKALDADKYIELFVRAVSDEMASISGEHVRRDWSGDGGLAFSA